MTGWSYPVEHRADGDGVLVRLHLPDHRSPSFRVAADGNWAPAPDQQGIWPYGGTPPEPPDTSATGWPHALPARYLAPGRPAQVHAMPDGTVRGYRLDVHDGGWRQVEDADLAALQRAEPAGEAAFVRAVELTRAAEIDPAVAVRAIYDELPAAVGDDVLVDELCAQTHLLYEGVLGAYTHRRAYGTAPATFADWVAAETARDVPGPPDRGAGPAAPRPGPGPEPAEELAAAFARYLRLRPDPAATPAFADALEEHGLLVEAELLAAYARRGPHLAGYPGGPPWEGARVHVGPRPPRLPRPYDLWFDVVEAALSVAVPNPPEPGELYFPQALVRGWAFYTGWVALEPVPRWRYATFLAVAEIVAPSGDTPDPSRLTAGEPLAPLTGTTYPEAAAYASWIGREIAGSWISGDTAARLPADRLDELAGESEREWKGEHDGEFYASPFGTSIDDDEDICDDPDALFFPWDTAQDVAFRLSSPAAAAAPAQRGDGSGRPSKIWYRTSRLPRAD